MQIKVTFGMKSVTEDISYGSTVGSVINKREVRDYLGYGESVRPTIDDVEVTLGDELNDGDEIVLLTKSNSKA